MLSVQPLTRESFLYSLHAGVNAYRLSLAMIHSQVLEGVAARIKGDHWVLGLSRHRWYTVHIRNPHQK